MPFPLPRTALPLLAAATLWLPVPAAAQATSCQFMQVAQVPLHYAGNGLGLTMTGAINGKPATMLPDTGAGVTYLTRTGIERHGLSTRAAGGHVQGVAASRGCMKPGLRSLPSARCVRATCTWG